MKTIAPRGPQEGGIRWDIKTSNHAAPLETSQVAQRETALREESQHRHRCAEATVRVGDPVDIFER